MINENCEERCKMSRYITIMLPSGQPAQMRLSDGQYMKIVDEFEKGQQKITDLLDLAGNIIKPYLESYGAEEGFNNHNSRNYVVVLEDKEGTEPQYMDFSIKVVNDLIHIGIELCVEENKSLEIEGISRQKPEVGVATPTVKNILKSYKIYSHSMQFTTDVENVAHAFHSMMKTLNDELAHTYSDVNSGFEKHNKVFLSQ